MSYLRENVTKLYERVANAQQLANEMATWHEAQDLSVRPRERPPTKSMLYSLTTKPKEAEEAKQPTQPRQGKLEWLCFWVLHGRADRPYNAETRAEASELLRDLTSLSPSQFWLRHSGLAERVNTVAQAKHRDQGKRFHLVGLGALNIDLIARLENLPAGIPAAAEAHFDAGTERMLSRRDFEAKAGSISRDRISESLGGSAFNVILALRHAAPKLRLGYVGCVGADRSELFRQFFHESGVDQRFVFEDKKALTSCSLSLIDASGERTLLTTKGDANDRLPDYLEGKSEIVDYLANAQWVHISSIFDERMPATLLDTILEVRHRNPVVRISFDPGWVWCEQMNKSRPLEGILKNADLLFLNPKEFELLAGAPVGDEESAARCILQRCSEDACVLVYKHPSRTSLFSWNADGEFMHKSLPHRVLAASEIVDSTGAGDVLAAGLLVRWLVPGIDFDQAMRLAAEMVDLKLRSIGTSDFHKFKGVLSRILEGEKSPP